MHRVRAGFINTRMANEVKYMIADDSNALCVLMRDLALRLLSHVLELNWRRQEINHQADHLSRQSSVYRRLQRVPSIGPSTAMAREATVGDGRRQHWHVQECAGI